MINVNITEFRANLLSYLNKAQNGEQIMVTSNGQSLATVIAPVNQKAIAKAKLKTLAKTAVIGDVISPSEEQWDAMK